MSDHETSHDAERSATVAFLSTVPLLKGIPERELGELAGLLRRRELGVGEVLWHEGEEAVGMVLIIGGRVSLSLRLPGERTIEFTSSGAGDVLGEVPLLDGGQHSAPARVVEPASLLWLSRADFAALVARRQSTAFALSAALPASRVGGCAPGWRPSPPRSVTIPLMDRPPRRRLTLPISNRAVPPTAHTSHVWPRSAPSTRSRSGDS